MRDHWNRATALLDLDLDQLSELIQPRFPDQTASAAELTEGGLANTNIHVWLAPSKQELLVRLYVRNADEGRKELPLHERLAGHVPVPRFFFSSPSNPVTGHPYALMEWINGSRLETIAPTLAPSELHELGVSVGAALAAIHAVTFPVTGFLAPDLAVAQPISVGSDGLLGFLEHSLINGRGAARLGTALTTELLRFVQDAGGLLDTWDGPPCLAHGDYGGSNILVARNDTGWQVAAVLDWEFAYSGSPFGDFGNLLRPPLGDMPGFEQAVQEGYQAAGGRLPPHWRHMSRLADLLSWGDFLNRSTPSAAMIHDAQSTIIHTMRVVSGS